MHPDRVAELIRAGLPNAKVTVEGEDQTHFAALVVSPDFAGKRLLARHQMVYRSLGELVGREIHALQLDTVTPEEFATRDVG